MTHSNSNDKVRHLIVWEVPSVGSPAFIEMYLNPSSIDIQSSKLINSSRTKGGFIIQYWGEELTNIAIRGQTGSGGIEALNVIRDIYRSEQLALQKIIKSNGENSKRRQSLAQLAASVVMWYQGQGHRGFFKTFSYKEAADNHLGMFDYTLEFVATQVIGKRSNYLPWHKKPWSSMDKPVFDDGRGSTTGGAYGSNFKMGELNAPAVNEETGAITDPEFTTRTGLTILPGTPEYDSLTGNLSENASPLSPSNLFAK